MFNLENSCEISGRILDLYIMMWEQSCIKKDALSVLFFFAQANDGGGGSGGATR